MPKVSAKHVQRRIADLDAQYTVAQTKRSGWRMVALFISRSLPWPHSLSPIAARPTLSNSP